jgi:TonB family protein
MHHAEADIRYEKRKNLLSGLISFLVVSLLILFLYLWHITTPIPPFEESPIAMELEMGTMDLGNNVEGMGDVDNVGMGQGTGEDSKAPPVNSGDPNQSNDDYLTSDVDPTAAVKTNPNHSNNTSASNDPKPDDELNSAIDIFKHNKGNNSGGDGNANQPGDKGVPGGDPNGGDFPGGGPGKGSGYSLKGRKMVKRPDAVYDSQEEGKVVVAIVVDQNGKVIKAEPGEPGSTTTSAILYTKARQAALTAKFNPSPDDVPQQRGTITFVFVLQ